MSISKSTLNFLQALAANNDRPWFDANKKTYEVAQTEVKKFAKAVHQGMEAFDMIESAKVMRIYRDVRFSKDKSPYKTNFGIGFTRAGAARRGGFYLHLQPGDCFIGGGFWDPNPEDIKRIREEFAVDDVSVRTIIQDPTFVKYFGELKGDALKTAPKGFEKDHPAIDLLRFKQYLLMRPLTDKQVLADNFLDEVLATYEAMMPFFNYMSQVLTTDLNGESIL